MKRGRFNQERAKRYCLAMRTCPCARDAELEGLELEETLNKENAVILDLGAGDGYLTEYLSKKFPQAKIYALDTSKSMLSKHKNKLVELINAESDSIPLRDGSVDLVVSLATFHHIKKKKETFEEVKRVLVQGGRFIIADVMGETSTQNFFDEVVKEYCISGHDFPFLTTPWVKELAQKTELVLESSDLKETPWKFKTRQDMALFIKNLMGLELSAEILLKFLFENFLIKTSGEEIRLGWQLGYHLLSKQEKARGMEGY